MRSIFLILAMSCWAAFGYAQETKNSRRDTADTNTRIEKLKQAFKQKDYNTFFKYFPDTYNGLLEIYGFDFNGQKGGNPLYHDGYNHINYLFKYEGHVIPKVFARKAYGIAKNGVWEADAVSYFQTNLEDLLLRKPKIFLEILATKSDKEATAFWHFLFDGSTRYAMSEQFEIFYSKINPLDKRQGKLLKEEFEKMHKKGTINDCED